MKLFIEDNGKRRPLSGQNMSFVQQKQAAAIVDSIGRLYPTEGVDYDINIIFKGVNNPNLSINIITLTDKGEFWRGYINQMLRKYPPEVDYHGDVLPEHQVSEEENQNKEQTNEQEQ